MIRRGLLALGVVLLAGAAAAQERIELPTRPGVTQPVFLAAVASPKASVILFPGNGGVVAQVRNNFLVRVGPRFVAAGMTVALFDAPSDRVASGMWAPFRSSAEHATDIAAVVALLKSRAPAPVWLIGTSMGTVSAAEGAVTIGPPRIAGVVLTSTVWQGGILSVALDQIRVPVLVVHNRDDGCRDSPYGDVSFGMARMQGAPVKELLTVSGGLQRGDPCEGRSPHGFFGIEEQVVVPIITWIEGH